MFQATYSYMKIPISTQFSVNPHALFTLEMFATLDKARTHTENVRGSNLAAFMCTTVQVSNTAVVD
jgi:hypothetical protein